MTDMMELRGDFIKFDCLLIVDIVNVQFYDIASNFQSLRDKDFYINHFILRPAAASRVSVASSRAQTTANVATTSNTPTMMLVFS